MPNRKTNYVKDCTHVLEQWEFVECSHYEEIWKCLGCQKEVRRYIECQ